MASPPQLTSTSSLACAKEPVERRSAGAPASSIAAICVKRRRRDLAVLDLAGEDFEAVLFEMHYSFSFPSGLLIWYIPNAAVNLRQAAGNP